MDHPTSAVSPFLTDGGEVGALMRLHDWSGFPLGAPDAWPQSLSTVVGLMLNSKFPMFVAWGPELGFLYNDSYAEILGGKHPTALGRRFEAIWQEIWSDIGPIVAQGQPRWEAVVRFVLNALVAAEESGVTQANVDEQKNSQSPKRASARCTSGARSWPTAADILFTTRSAMMGPRPIHPARLQVRCRGMSELRWNPLLGEWIATGLPSARTSASPAP